MTLPGVLLTAAFLACSGRLLGRRQEPAEYRVALENHENEIYTANMTIGGQVIPMLYDTGSLRVVVMSTLCRDCAGDQHDLFDPSKSATYQGSSVKTRIVYGSGSVVAQKSFDTLRIGDSNSPYNADGVFFQVTKYDGPKFMPGMWSSISRYKGIVGLAISATAPKTFGITRFGICLRRDEKDGEYAPGILTFQPQLPSGIFRPFTVDGWDHWSVPMTHFGADGVDAPNPCADGCSAIIDSGTSLIAVPPSAFGVVNKLRGLIDQLVDCADLSSMPTLKLQLDGKMLELPPHAYVVSPNHYKTCTHGFVEIRSQSMSQTFVLGISFLRYYTAVYDTEGTGIIHMAESSPNCEASAATVSLLNTTQGGIVTHATSMRLRAFGGSDYRPLAANRSNMRLPSWATDGPEDSKM